MSTESTEALIERVLAEHAMADLGEPQHRTCVAAAITQALAEREHMTCHRDGDLCIWDGCPNQHDDNPCEGCFLIQSEETQ